MIFVPIVFIDFRHTPLLITLFISRSHVLPSSCQTERPNVVKCVYKYIDGAGNVVVLYLRDGGTVEMYDDSWNLKEALV